MKKKFIGIALLFVMLLNVNGIDAARKTNLDYGTYYHSNGKKKAEIDIWKYWSWYDLEYKYTEIEKLWDINGNLYWDYEYYDGDETIKEYSNYKKVNGKWKPFHTVQREYDILDVKQKHYINKLYSNGKTSYKYSFNRGGEHYETFYNNNGRVNYINYYLDNRATKVLSAKKIYHSNGKLAYFRDIDHKVSDTTTKYNSKGKRTSLVEYLYFSKNRKSLSKKIFYYGNGKTKNKSEYDIINGKHFKEAYITYKSNGKTKVAKYYTLNKKKKVKLIKRVNYYSNGKRKNMTTYKLNKKGNTKKFRYYKYNKKGKQISVKKYNI